MYLREILFCSSVVDINIHIVKMCLIYLLKSATTCGSFVKTLFIYDWDMGKIVVMLLVLFTWRVSAQKEPICPSSFDFQYSLLRKLVFLETELEIIKAKVRELENNINGKCFCYFYVLFWFLFPSGSCWKLSLKNYSEIILKYIAVNTIEPS